MEGEIPLATVLADKDLRRYRRRSRARREGGKCKEWADVVELEAGTVELDHG